MDINSRISDHTDIHINCIASQKFRQCLAQRLFTDMVPRILRQASLDFEYETLRFYVGVLMYVPTVLHKPIFEILQRGFANNVVRQAVSRIWSTVIMSESPVPIVRVTVPELRRMFNEGGFVERTAKGELREVIMHSGVPNPEIGLPAGTKSQMVSDIDANNSEIARAHRFMLPDGTLGASGKPDPKRMMKDGILYRIIKLNSFVTGTRKVRDAELARDLFQVLRY